MNDYLVKAYAFSGTVRIYAAITTNLVEEARKIHHTWPAATAAFGRVLTAGVIMGAMYKGEQTLTIRIEGDGPIGNIVAVVNATGTIKGYVDHPHVHMSTNDDKLAVGKVVGNNGFIHVTKDLKVRDIFTSSAELQTGEIGDDFTYYFAKSEQIPSSVGLGVLVDTDNSVLAAGGFILQVMPGAKPETLDKIEANIQSMRPVSALVKEAYTPEMIVAEITKGDHTFLEHLEVSYACDCTREKFARGILSLNEAEVDEIVGANETVETVCRFCGTKYHFEPLEIQSMRKEKHKHPVQ